MKISLNWLKKYIDLPAEAKELEKLLTFAGIEVEAVTRMPALPDTVISAKVIFAEPVPKTDHLQRCLVDVGNYPSLEKDEDGYVQVICGAPNCHAGMMAILALPGSALAEITINKAKIRGVESHGMLCSEKELGISDNHAGIIELPSDTVCGITANELYELPDLVFELEITPNRPDLLGYLGIARDLSAKLNLPLRLPQIQVPEASSADLTLTLVNKSPQLCSRYIARLFKGVRIGQSPLWLKSALIKSGLRPINNLVDITNFVLLEYGHPLHAFDYDKLAALPSDMHPAIVIRQASAGEGFTALDGKSYSLDGGELVIADGAKPSALAGVMGGIDSAISGNTCNIVLESAAFNPGSIRKTSYKHKLSTDSSYRFERHLSDHAPSDASLRATQLICELTKAELCSQCSDSWENPSQPLILGIRPSRYEQVIGYALEDAKIKEYLEKLGLRFLQYGSWKEGKIASLSEVYCHHSEELKQGKTEFSELPDCIHSLYFEIPAFRVDLEREIDLIEELARLDGYEKVPVKTLPRRIMDPHAYRIRKVSADYLVSRGCYETLNYSFTDPALMHKLGYQESDPELQMIRLINPQSGTMSAMRTSLVPQLLQNLAYNLNRGERNIKLFELGKIYSKVQKEVSAQDQSTATTEPMHLAAIFTGQDRDEHWQNKSQALSGTLVKGIMEELLQLHHLKANTGERGAKLPFLTYTDTAFYSYQGMPLGYYGKLAAQVAESYGIDLLDLKQDIWLLQVNMDNLVQFTRDSKLVFTPLTRFPAVTRDISFLIDNSIRFSEIESCVKSIDNELIKELSVFDEYRGKQIPEGFRSLSLHIKFQDKEKTLTDERIDQLVDSVLELLKLTWQVTMR